MKIFYKGQELNLLEIKVEDQEDAKLLVGNILFEIETNEELTNSQREYYANKALSLIEEHELEHEKQKILELIDQHHLITELSFSR